MLTVGQPSVGAVSRPRRNLLVLLATLVVVAILTDKAFDAGREATRYTYYIAGALFAGVLLSGEFPKESRGGKRPVVKPAITGALLFVTFAILGWLTGWIDSLDDGAAEIIRRARAGPGWEVALGTLIAAVAEEVFYRGALFEGVRLPVVKTTLAHMATTLLVGNPALTLSAGLLGFVLGLQRRASGGWWSPAVTHVVWGLMIVAWLPT